MQSEAIAIARDLKVGYPEGHVAACPDFSLSPGDFLCVCGENGCGKTALLKTVAGLLPPVAGELSLRPRRAKGGSSAGLSIGYLPQLGPVHKDFPASVIEVVRSGCQAMRGLRPFYTFAERRRAQRMLERLGMADLASRAYRELSGGQRQRVLIARALVAPRDLLLFDEPTNALDAASSVDLMRLLREINGKGVAVMMVTHDPAAASAATAILRLGANAAFAKGGADA